MKARVVYRSSLIALAFLACVNLALAVYVYIRLKSPVNYNVQVIEPQPLQLPTPPDFLSSTNVVTSDVVLPIPQPVIEHYTLKFKYFEVGGVPAAFLNGKYLYPNSRHAYGVVRDIYPERIYFEGGSYIDNERSTTHDTVNTGSVTPP